MNPETLRSAAGLERLRQAIMGARDPNRPRITICAGTGCRAAGAEEVVAAFTQEIQKHNLAGKVDLKLTGCHGFCERGTLVVLKPKNVLYQQVRAADVPDIIAQSVMQDGIIERLLYVDPATAKAITHENEVPFYSRQTRLLLGPNGEVDPTSIEDYIAIGGYSALAKALAMTPDEIIDEIKHSGLRGRGGAGFPTGRKWESCRRAKGSRKYVICNADEGDPGAYMDRSIMEGNPHSVLEGMIIGAYAIGASEGYIYIRNEYPLAVQNSRIAIEQATAYGFLGEGILGSEFDLSLKINRGGGAFVCGESTALMASLEGRVGEPRAKYVHTVDSGLWERPSNLNNVKTWASIPLIIGRGADWYSRMGTDGSKGTAIFSLVGKVNNTGLVEVPMGMTLREIIFDIGGGIRDGKKFKAVQTGGPSGGCLPEDRLHLPVDFDELTKAGSMMGSGGMIVMDEDTCMVDVARYFVDFLEEESCGKCVPCREGLKRMNQVLTAITEGRGREDHLEVLSDLGDLLREAALCALGQTAANPVLSTIRYFKDEYEAHIRDKTCPAKVCSALIEYYVIEDKCPGCGLCVKACPQGAIEPRGKKQPVVLDSSKCIKCNVCYDTCKLGALGKK